MSKTRVYAVDPVDANSQLAPRLIEANSPGQAVKHAAKDVFKVKVASGKEVADGVRAGLEVEVVRDEPQALLIPE